MSESGDDWERMEQRTIRVVVVGPAGEGKSSLINSLIFEQKCGRYSQATAHNDPSKLVEASFDVSPDNGENLCSVLLYDSPGLTGRKEEDKDVLRQVREKIPQTPDLILVCMSFASNSGRFLPMFHIPILEQTMKMWEQDENAFKKTVIVLTKCDLVSKQFEEEAAARLAPTEESRKRGAELFESDFAAWKSELRSEVDGDLGGLHVAKVGLVEFGEDDKPVKINAVCGKKTWHDDLLDILMENPELKFPASVFRAKLNEVKGDEATKKLFEPDDGEGNDHFEEKDRTALAKTTGVTLVATGGTAVIGLPIIGAVGVGCAAGAIYAKYYHGDTLTKVGSHVRSYLPL